MSENNKKQLPQVVLIMGMAGTGKTTFATSFYRFLAGTKGKKVYAINLDPAVDQVPFPTNVDIRDTINYKEVMKTYNLGPNGAIMTSINLFATKFDKVLDLIEKKCQDPSTAIDYILIDTPGQIEVFNWSAGGSIVLDLLAMTYPMCIAFVLDSQRCQKPNSFITSMMYACSVLYKSKLPLIAIFNKCDVVLPDRCISWLKNMTDFAEAADEAEDSYATTFAKSTAFLLQEFYEAIQTIQVSSTLSLGFHEIIDKLAEAKVDYFENYVPWLEAQKAAMQEKRKFENDEEIQRLQRDLHPLEPKETDEDFYS